jgi:hypothetical protein
MEAKIFDFIERVEYWWQSVRKDRNWIMGTKI